MKKVFVLGIAILLLAAGCATEKDVQDARIEKNQPEAATAESGSQEMAENAGNYSKIIEKIEGVYVNETGIYNVSIEYRDNFTFHVKTNYPMFSQNEVDVKLNDVYKKILFSYEIGGRGGIGGSIVIKFDKEKNLILQEDYYECEFDDDLNPINEEETHKIEILRKDVGVFDVSEESAESEMPLSEPDYSAAYQSLLNYLHEKKEFIRKNYEMIDDDEKLYKGNTVFGPNAFFVNNELLGGASLKIGMTKKDVYALLGEPWRVLKDGDYVDYWANLHVKDFFDDGQETFYASTVIGFYFDADEKITQISVLVEGVEEPSDDDFWP
jgi:hypothetical protein